MSEDAIIVFTAKSVERILKEGGTSAWRLDRNHARQCTYAVCTRNAHADWTEGPEPHHTAFIIGKIKDVVPAAQSEGRFLVQFSEYARLDLPNAWQGGRNPISYRTLKDLGIDLSEVRWQPMPEPSETHEVTRPAPTIVGALTFAQAKKGLAEGYGVSPHAIEIIIRG